VWSTELNDWVKIAPSTAAEIGAETPAGAQEKADVAETNAKDFADAVLVSAKEFTQTYANKKIEQGPTLPIGPAVGDLWIDTSKSPHQWKRWSGTIWTKASATSLDELSGLLESAQVAVGAIKTANIAEDAISSIKIQNEAVGVDKIGNGAITNAKLSDLAVDAAKLAGSAVTAEKIANLAVGNAAIANGAITNAKINDLDAGKITAGTIAADRIGANSITATHIAGNTITAAQIAGETITANELKAGSVIAGKIAANAVTAENIAANSITSSMVVTAGLDAGVIKFGTMSGDRILANTITSDKISTEGLDASVIKTGIIDSVTYRSGYSTAQRFELSGGTATFTEDMESGKSSVTKINDNGISVSHMDGLTEEQHVGVHGNEIVMRSGPYSTGYYVDHLEFKGITSPEFLMLQAATNYGELYAAKPLRLTGNENTLEIANETLRYNGSPIGFSGNEILWTGAELMNSADYIYPTRKLSDCPNGWIFVWSRFVDGSSSNSDWNFTVVPKGFATFTNGGSWHSLPATNSSALTTAPPIAYKYMYATDTAAQGHARNVGGTEGGQCLRYVLAF